jgi:hypothetical protein
MFRMNPQFIVAGEIVRTTRMYAMSVSPLPFKLLEKISPALIPGLGVNTGGREKEPSDRHSSRTIAKSRPRDFTNNIKIGSEVFEIETVKGKKQVSLPWEKVKKVIDHIGPETASMYKNLRGVIILDNQYRLLGGEKLHLILSLLPSLELESALDRNRISNERFNSSVNLDGLLASLPNLVKPAFRKQGKKELGFICLFTDGNGNYRFSCSRGFNTSLNESLASVENLIDELGDDVDIDKKHIVNQTYRRLADYLNGMIL